MASKISKVGSRYSEWWLALYDRIGYGELDESDCVLLRDLVQADETWTRIILVNPFKPSVGLEL